MNINASEFLTADQKSELGTALFNKMLVAIESTEYAKGGKVNVSKLIQYEIDQIFEQSDIYDNIDFTKVGKALTGKILAGIN